MPLSFKSQLPNLDGIYAALFAASEVIYAELKQGSGLKFATSSNESGDDQIELDVIADEAFFETLSQDPNVRYVVSEERPGMSKISDGAYSIALDPLDGSKSALVGIPSGAIFGVWKDAEVAADFSGRNLISSGFFVFGMNLEAYFADGPAVYKGNLITRHQNGQSCRLRGNCLRPMSCRLMLAIKPCGTRGCRATMRVFSKRMMEHRSRIICGGMRPWFLT